MSFSSWCSSHLTIAEAKKLLAQGVPRPKFLFRYGSPIWEAIQNDQTKMANWLLGNLPAEEWKPTIPKILEDNQHEIINFLLRKRWISPQDKIWDSPSTTIFMHACMCSKVPLVDRLLRAGGNPEQQDKRGDNAFFYAIRNRDVDVLRSLYNFTGRMDYRNHHGKTILHDAIKYSENLPAIKVIFELKALDINARDRRGQTPLHFFVDLIDKKIARWLLSQPGWNTNAQDWLGRTPWHRYLYKVFTSPDNEVLQLLMKYPGTDLSGDENRKIIGGYFCSLAQLYSSNKTVVDFIWRKIEEFTSTYSLDRRFVLGCIVEKIMDESFVPPDESTDSNDLYSFDDSDTSGDSDTSEDEFCRSDYQRDRNLVIRRKHRLLRLRRSTTS